MSTNSTREPACGFHLRGAFSRFNRKITSFSDFRTDANYGDACDLAPEQIAQFQASIAKIRSHAFYELRVNAIAAALRGDTIVAIVLGCAALEGVHGAFLRLIMQEKVPNDASKFNSFMNSLLREQGFFSLVQLSSRVFLAKTEQPSERILEDCLAGVSIRNSIMHAGVKGTGKYKMKEYSEKELNEGYSGIMAMYSIFETALEQHLAPCARN